MLAGLGGGGVGVGRGCVGVADGNVNYYTLLGNSLKASVKSLKRSLTQQLHS